MNDKSDQKSVLAGVYESRPIDSTSYRCHQDIDSQGYAILHLGELPCAILIGFLYVIKYELLVRSPLSNGKKPPFRCSTSQASMTGFLGDCGSSSLASVLAKVQSR